MENSSTNSVGFSKVKYENASEGTGISTNVYNLIMGGMILYGIIINIVMCMTCTKLALSINPIVLFVGYLVLVIAGTFMVHRSRSTAIRFVGSAGVSTQLRSSSVTGLMAQWAVGRPGLPGFGIPPTGKQPLWQAMQGRISASRPSLALLSHSGSARN